MQSENLLRYLYLENRKSSESLYTIFETQTGI